MDSSYLELIPYLKNQNSAKSFVEFLDLLPDQSRLRPFFREHFQLIIYHSEKNIHFLIRIPKKHKAIIMQNLYTKHPNLTLKNFSFKEKFKWHNLKVKILTKNEEVNSLKTFQEFETSPLNTILNTIQKYEILKIQLRNSSHSTKNEASIPLKLVKLSLGYTKQFPKKLLNSLQQYSSNKILINSKIPQKIKLTSEEIASFFHIPNQDCNFDKLNYNSSKTIAAPNTLKTTSCLLAKTNHKEEHKSFGIAEEDRRRHLYIIGKTGMGKSTLLENLIISDLKNKKGLALLDPHGDLYQSLLNKIPSYRSNELILFNPFDENYPISFNPLQEKQYKHLSISGLVSTFKKLFSHSWGPRLEYVLRNSLLTLAEYPNTSLLGLPKLLTEEKYRNKLCQNLKDPILAKFWQNEFNNLSDKQRLETISPILNKTGQFFSSPICRNILSQSKNKLDLKFAMDSQKIILINLSKGQLGEDISQLLGSLLITKFQIDAMSRVNQIEEQRKDFFLYIDEFQNFATESFINILSEARKYRLNLTIANQYLDQILPEIKDAIFGNIGSLISFQVGAKDASYLSQELSNQVEILPNDLQNLPKYQIFLKLLQNGVPLKSFSAKTLSPLKLTYKTAKTSQLIKLSRERYSQTKSSIEKKIQTWNKI